MAEPSKSFKVTLGGLVAVVSIVTALQPYFDLKGRAEENTKQILGLKTKAELDHDLIIKMSSDIQYIRETVQDLKQKGR